VTGICPNCHRVVTGPACEPDCDGPPWQRESRLRIVTFSTPMSRTHGLTDARVTLACRAHRVDVFVCVPIPTSPHAVLPWYARAIDECLRALPCGCGRPRAACSQRGSW
jgi:hypothetical protein